MFQTTLSRGNHRFQLVFRCPECGQVTSPGDRPPDQLSGVPCKHCQCRLDEDDLGVLPQEIESAACPDSEQPRRQHESTRYGAIRYGA